MSEEFTKAMRQVRHIASQFESVAHSIVAVLLDADAEQVVETLLGENLQSKMPHLVQQFPEFGEEVINQVAEIDPTRSKSYITWLLRNLRKGAFQPDEDADEIRDSLAQFDQFKRRGNWTAPRDINAYAQIGDLHEAVAAYVARAMPAPQQPEPSAPGAEPEPPNLIARHGNLRLYALRTPQEVVEAARGTSWCVKKSSMAAEYLKSGPLMLVTKAARPYVLVSPSQAEVRDIRDRFVTPEIADEIAPLLRHIPARAWMNILVGNPSPDDMRRRLHLLDMSRRRYIEDMMRGTRPGAEAEAEAAWQKQEPAFRRAIVDEPSPLVSRRHGLGPSRLEPGLKRLIELLNLPTMSRT